MTQHTAMVGLQHDCTYVPAAPGANIRACKAQPGWAQSDRCCCYCCQCLQVMSKRKTPPGSPSTALRELARDCTEELGVYSSSRRRTNRLEQWNKGLPLAPLR